MKKTIFRLSILIAILFSFQIKSVDWSGDITTDVVDQNITITGNCTIVGPGVVPTGQIAVSAVNQNIEISATGALFVQGKTGGESDLYFYAAENRTITFDVDYDFDFKGSPDGTDMLVTFSGLGTLIFNLADGVRLQFTAEGNSGGVKFMIRMLDHFVSNVTFTRQNKMSDNNVEIIIGPKSLISYIAVDQYTTSDESGRITFDLANSLSNTGRMILTVEDQGGIYIGGNLLTQDIPDPRLSDIDMSAEAGSRAEVVLNGDSSAGLLILNYNRTFGDLQIDPWFTGAPVENRYGFVLGAIADIWLNEHAWIDYVGLSNNICLDPDIPDDILTGRSVESVIKKRNPSAFIVDGDVDIDRNATVFSTAGIGGIYFRSGVDRYGDINPEFTVDKNNITSGEGEIIFDVEGKISIDRTALQILSLEVTPTGGSVLIDSNETNFPARTFAKDADGDYIVYNKGAFLINNNMRLSSAYLVHTDANHQVCENNILAVNHLL